VLHHLIQVHSVLHIFFQQAFYQLFKVFAEVVFHIHLNKLQFILDIILSLGIGAKWRLTNDNLVEQAA